MISERYKNALDVTFDLHKNDQRKGKSTPYIAHLLSVSSFVLEDGGTEDEAIAALLHDALEDHPDLISYQDLVSRFGVNVAGIVRACSDTPDDFKGGEKPPWKERKQAYLDHLKHSSSGVLRVALADKLHNSSDLIADLQIYGESVWNRFNAGKKDQAWFYRQLLKVFTERISDSRLLTQFRHIVDYIDILADPQEEH